MTLRFTRWQGSWRRAVPLALAAALIAIPVAATEATPAAKSTNTSTGRVSLRQSVAREASRTALVRSTTARRAAQGTAGKQSSGFFKSRAGAVAIAVMGVGVGYAVYSTKHDRITSPAKK